MKRSILLLALGMALGSRGQWEVPVPIELNGTTDQDRQIIGLADPVALHAAVSVDASRNSAVSYTTVTGGLTLIGDLVPAPAAYNAGMLVTIVPDAPNVAAAQLNLNDLGAQEIVKAGGVPLEAGDLMVGAPARLMHDGMRFRLLSSTYLPCPAGFHIGGREYCIEDSSRVDTGFFEANRICRDAGARLCTFSEWAHACRKDPSFLPTVTDWEWVDSSANDTNDAKLVGYGGDGLGSPNDFGCNRGHTGEPFLGRPPYRCCTHR